MSCVKAYEQEVDNDTLQEAVLNKYFVSLNEINSTEIVEIK